MTNDTNWTQYIGWLPCECLQLLFLVDAKTTLAYFIGPFFIGFKNRKIGGRKIWWKKGVIDLSLNYIMYVEANLCIGPRSDVGRRTGAMSGEVFYGRSVRRSEGSRTAKGIVGRRTADRLKFLLLFRTARTFYVNSSFWHKLNKGYIFKCHILPPSSSSLSINIGPLSRNNPQYIANLDQNNNTNFNTQKKTKIINIFYPALIWIQMAIYWAKRHTNVPPWLN